MTNNQMRMRRRGQQGFSLVELMVALLLGLLVVAGGLQIVSTITQTFRATERLAERQNQLIAVTELLALDVRTAEALALEDDDDTLAVELPGTRRADYCSNPGTAPFTVRYFQDGQDLILDLEDCDGTQEVLASGIAVIDFNLLGDDEEAPHSVEVTLRQQSEASAPPIVFRTTSRALAVAAKEAES